jgi:hypothetical protein
VRLPLSRLETGHLPRDRIGTESSTGLRETATAFVGPAPCRTAGWMDLMRPAAWLGLNDDRNQSGRL